MALSFTGRLIDATLNTISNFTVSLLSDASANGKSLITASNYLAMVRLLGIDVQFNTSSTIADDAVGTITLGGAVGSGFLFIASTTTGGGAALFHFRATTTPLMTLVASTGTWAGSTATLTGTTGTDGAETVSPSTGGVITLENRSGASRTYSAYVLQQSF